MFDFYNSSHMKDERLETATPASPAADLKVPILFSNVESVLAVFLFSLLLTSRDSRQFINTNMPFAGRWPRAICRIITVWPGTVFRRKLQGAEEISAHYTELGNNWMTK